MVMKGSHFKFPMEIKQGLGCIFGFISLVGALVTPLLPKLKIITFDLSSLTPAWIAVFVILITLLVVREILFHDEKLMRKLGTRFTGIRDAIFFISLFLFVFFIIRLRIVTLHLSLRCFIPVMLFLVFIWIFSITERYNTPPPVKNYRAETEFDKSEYELRDIL